jgi:deuterolysin
MKGFTQFTLAALATYVSAVSVDLNKRESPLSVVLSAAGNTEVKVAVTNNGDKTLNLLSKGTFLDEENPVEKVSVFSTSGSKFITYTLYAQLLVLETDWELVVIQASNDS